jgi:RNA polymerase sigma factor (sigma-70 family)
MAKISKLLEHGLGPGAGRVRRDHTHAKANHHRNRSTMSDDHFSLRLQELAVAAAQSFPATDRSVLLELEKLLRPQLLAFLAGWLGPGACEIVVDKSLDQILQKAVRGELCVYPYGAWACCKTITIRRRIDWQRNHLPHDVSLDDEKARAEHRVADLQAPAPSDRETSDIVASVNDALAKLKPKDQEVLRMFHLGGDFSLREISAVIGDTEQSVRTRVWRARDRLREFLAVDPRLRAFLQRSGIEQPPTTGNIT